MTWDRDLKYEPVGVSPERHTPWKHAELERVLAVSRGSPSSFCGADQEQTAGKHRRLICREKALLRTGGDPELREHEQNLWWASYGRPRTPPSYLTGSPHSPKTGILGSIFIPWSVGLAGTRATRSWRAHRTNVEASTRLSTTVPVPDPPLKRGLLSGNRDEDRSKQEYGHWPTSFMRVNFFWPGNWKFFCHFLNITFSDIKRLEGDFLLFRLCFCESWT